MANIKISQVANIKIGQVADAPGAFSLYTESKDKKLAWIKPDPEELGRALGAFTLGDGQGGRNGANVETVWDYCNHTKGGRRSHAQPPKEAESPAAIPRTTSGDRKRVHTRVWESSCRAYPMTQPMPGANSRSLMKVLFSSFF